GGGRFRSLEAAVFPFLLLPAVPLALQPPVLGLLLRLLEADPLNAALMCHVRMPLLLLKLAVRLPTHEQVRLPPVLLLLLAYSLRPQDARLLFGLAALEPAAWTELAAVRLAAAPLGPAEEAGEGAAGRGDGSGGELQMQMLYVIGTVVETAVPACFFHLDGSLSGGLFSDPLDRFPSVKTGYSLSLWVRPTAF
ncbi:unnamed protein product, partial [Phaeothamnion confervicola]